MISGLDLNIYQALFQQKKLTEKYIGKVKFDWVYSEVHYTAECTVGVPFDLFDKTIVGILLVDEVLSIEEIGDILGMNVIHSPENQQYRDDAEFDILRMALDNLYYYKMIEIGDTYYSSCSLTSIGREYAQKGRKFKIENNKPFSLMYDHTSQNHIDAKALFKGLKGNPLDFGKLYLAPKAKILPNYDFVDETLMKQIAAKQANEVYDEQKGNSFINPSIDFNKSQTFSLKLYVPLLYDLENGDIRLMVYEPTTKTINEYFSKWLNENKLEEIINEFLIANPSDRSLLELPQEYVQSVIQMQNDFEKEIIDNPSNALVIAEKVNQDLNYVDIEYFWNNLNSFITNETKECWFFLQEYSIGILNGIENLFEKELTLFLVLQKVSDAKLMQKVTEIHNKSKNLDNRIFIIVAEQLEDTLCVLGNIAFNIGQFNIYSGYSFSCLMKNKRPIDLLDTKALFASEYIPLILDSVEIEIDLLKNVDHFSKDFIKTIDQIDRKALMFTDLQEHEDILQQIFQVEQYKKNFISTIKEQHELQIKSELQVMFDDFFKQNFSILEPLQEFKNRLQFFQNELLEDYTDLQKEVDGFENKIKEEEKRIKDEILAKTYIIDTNVFIEEPDIISKIDSKHYIALTLTAIEELDKLKTKEKTKANALKAIKSINEVLKESNKQKKPRVKKARANLDLLPIELRQKSGDNYLLSMALIYQDEQPVILTLDKNLQSKAIMLNIEVLTLKDFLRLTKNNIITSTNEVLKNEKYHLDYHFIFERTPKDKQGNKTINEFIKSIKKIQPDFEYNSLGFKDELEFIKSLYIFHVNKNQYITLKNKK
jgi:hypothetical protein